jgi:PKD repeat protein
VSNATYSLNGLDASFDGGSLNATSHSWDFGDAGTSSEMNPQHTYSQTGFYTVQHVASSICGSDTSTFEISVAVSSVHDPDPIDELQVLIQNGVVTVSNDLNDDVSISMIDLSGRTVLTKTLSSNSTTIFDVNLNIGIYLIQLEDGIHRSTRKVVLQ